MRTLKTFWPLLLLLALGGCWLAVSFRPGAVGAEPIPQGATGATPSSTAQMVELLRVVREKAAQEHRDPYRNSERADLLGMMVAGATDPRQRSEYTARLTQELLNAGRTQEAIQRAEQLMAFVQRSGERLQPEARLTVLHLLGICYMRLGEQTNCQLNHTDASCIMPIAAEARHVDPQGSQLAIGVYTRILEEFPDDLTARWLLNVASMTLGQHPDGVPKKWLIPAAAFGPTDGFPKFKDIATGLGVDLGMGTVAGGTCMEDFDNDGDLDLMVSSWSLYQQIKLLLNRGDGTFADVTEQSGLVGITGGLNMVHADYDNDGNVDVLVLRGAWVGSVPQPNSLLHNLGNGKFEDVTVAAGLLNMNNNSQAGQWGDFNNDGLLDLFVGEESAQQPMPCHLYRNNGNGTFTDVAQESGVATVGFIKGAAMGDVNNDGFIDIYVSDLNGPNRLYMSHGPDASGNCTFTDVAASLGVTKPDNAFPAWMWDYDNDG